MDKDFNRLYLLIKRFSLSSIKEHVFKELIPLITFEQIQNKIKREKNHFNPKTFSTYIVETLKKKNINSRKLKNVISSIELTFHIQNSKKKLWHIFRIEESNTFISSIVLLNRFRKYFSENVITKTSEESIWVLVSMPKISHIIFVYYPGENYFFCSKKSFTNDLLMKLSKVFDCKELKLNPLNGRDIKSLRLFINSKIQGTLEENFLEPPKFVPDPPKFVESLNGVIINQDEARKKYADDIFGETPPTLDSFTIMSTSKDPQKHYPFYKGENLVDIRLKFTSRNVMDTYKKCIKNKIFNVPLPDYLNNIPTSGKNFIVTSID